MTDSAPDPTELALDLSARLASGAAHELGGLLFAIRLRLETLALGPLGSDRDLDAVAKGVAGIQDVVDALRLLGARSGTGRIVRAQTIDGASWWRRIERLARYLLPPTIALEGRVAAGLPLARIALGRFTEAALVLIAEAARSGGPVIVTLDPDQTGRALLLTAGPVPPEPNVGLLGRARDLVRPSGGRIRTAGAEDGRKLVLRAPLLDEPR